MKKIYIIFLAFCLSHLLNAQEFVYLTTGASYNEQVYYRLSDDSNIHIANDEWDIAFTFVGDSTGIFVNESVRTSFGNPQNPVVALDAGDATWSSTINPDDLTTRLYNDEKSWAWGAFNSMRNADDPNDYGWGVYSEENAGVFSDKVFVVQLRDGSYKKLQIQNLVDGVYTVRYADLDGSNENNLTIEPELAGQSHIVCLSLSTGDFVSELVDLSWDMVFQRYVTDIMDTPFSVSGVLTDYGVQVAEARDISPEDATYDVYQDLLESDIDVIGHDWKEFNNGWIIQDQLSYFVLTEGPRLWKIQFYEFQGSSTGGITFEKTDLTDLVNTQSPLSDLQDIAISPNPASESVDIVFSIKNKPEGKLTISIMDIRGRTLRYYHPDVHLGLNAFRLNDLPKEKGIYFISLQSAGHKITRKLVVE